jgi:uncharacterized UBP type Zn finger protein
MLIKYSVSSPEIILDGKKIISEQDLKPCCEETIRGRGDCELQCKNCGNKIVLSTI